MKIFIYGICGNMGRRYQAILKYLGHTAVGVDLNADVGFLGSEQEEIESCDGIIIATPTENHFSTILKCAHFNKPILCEKPISKNLDQVKIVCDLKVPITMVNQYQYLDNKAFEGLTVYDYYNHGKDGLFWDCINIIGLARDHVILGEKSPLWRCALNGKELLSSQIDATYMTMIGEWLLNPRDGNKDYILHAHKKVQEMINANSN